MADTSYGASALRSTGPSMSLVENKTAGVGNYKGVMLCNRPFAGTSASSKQLAQPDKTTFTSGVVPEPVGVNIPISAIEKKLKRPKKDSVIAKHRKWLADLQKTKDELERQYVDEMKRKQENSQRFTDQEAKMRLLARAVSATSLDAVAKSEDKDSSSAEKSAQPKTTNTSQEDKSVGAAAKSVAASEKSSNRPAWALTEVAAAIASEEKMHGDEEDLINFAQGLDFEKYIGDMEVSVMVDRLRTRIGELEKELDQDEKRDIEVGERAAKRELLAQMKADASCLEDSDEGPEEDDDIAAARALLQAQEDLQAIHSAKSVATIIKQSKDKQELSLQVPSGPPKVLNEPQIVTHVPDEGSRLALKKAVSHLPYMHRNPAV